ncbi:hypothetical protein K466DRAFT_590646 [Polyporus arcularius HHB13444]|uniref:Uncharacterized protein n=1 Tax=Polyporus arcularius HHB13444 TaxID=1314778 RepID=A0A5C3NY41_9APHY|nr:hypothetical protein K466DRAFT_590646 [Polyporus arcularius HHB13444]
MYSHWGGSPGRWVFASGILDGSSAGEAPYGQPGGVQCPQIPSHFRVAPDPTVSVTL